jgi:hypothetical protein
MTIGYRSNEQKKNTNNAKILTKQNKKKPDYFYKNQIKNF